MKDEQCIAGNRDGLGTTPAVLKKISSEATLLQQDNDLISSLTRLRKKLI